MFDSPIKQNKLIGFNNEFNEISKLFKSSKKPNKLLFSGKKGIGKATLAYHLTNYVFSINEDYKYNCIENVINTQNHSYKLVLNKTHPNLFVVDIKDDKSSIDINQIRELIKFANKSSFNDKIKIILIDNAEYLNKSSSNSLLKILEDDNPKLFFILIHNSEKNIINTIKSRCVKFNLCLGKKYQSELLNKFTEENNLPLINKDFLTYYTSPGKLIEFCQFCTENDIDFENNSIENFMTQLINNKKLFTNTFVKINISNFIELYLYKKFYENKNNLKFKTLYYNTIKKISLFKKYNLDFESFLMDFNNLLLNE